MSAPVKIIRLSANSYGERSYWQAIRELCCRTGNNGAPIPRLRWPLFAKLWIEPYEKLIPNWTFAALVDGQVVGYLTGCPQSKRFRWRRLTLCRVPLVFELAMGRHLTDRSLLGFVLRSLPAELAIRRRFSAATRRTIENSLPAHLHINVDADFRSAGIGRQLIEAFLASLREQAVPGAHLYCGPAPLEFYRRMGFRELGNIDFNGARIFALAMNLIIL